MKKLFALLLAVVMVLSMAACDLGGGEESTSGNKDNSGTSQSEEQNDGGQQSDVTIKIATIDGYELPDVALAYVGTFNKAYNDLYNDGEITFYVKSKDADEDAFDALVAYYAANGGTADEANSTSTTKCFDFSWGRIEVAHFGYDEEISAYIILPQYPIAENQGGESNTNVLHELFDVEALASISDIPDYAKKAIGDLRWCDDLGADNHFRYCYNIYMKEVTQADLEAYFANLTANGPTDFEEGNIFAFYWEWGQITGEYFPDSGTLDVVLAAK